MLSHVRVLDLSDHRGLFCSHVLAQLGAEVIVVEPPGGHPARRLAPHPAHNASDDDGLYWQGYARGAQSITLNAGSDAAVRSCTSCSPAPTC